MGPPACRPPTIYKGRVRVEMPGRVGKHQILYVTCLLSDINLRRPTPTIYKGKGGGWAALTCSRTNHRCRVLARVVNKLLPGAPANKRYFIGSAESLSLSPTGGEALPIQ